MGYENATATKLLATDCCVCGRPLLDALSVELGIGPVCREKYGFSEGPDADRARANAIIHACAVSKSAAELNSLVNELHQAGWVKLAAKIAERFVSIRIMEKDGYLLVQAPYNYDAVGAFRAIPGHRWDRDTKANSYPLSAFTKMAVWNLLLKFYRGQTGTGTRGLFKVEPTAATPKVERKEECRDPEYHDGEPCDCGRRSEILSKARDAADNWMKMNGASSWV